MSLLSSDFGKLKEHQVEDKKEILNLREKIAFYEREMKKIKERSNVYKNKKKNLLEKKNELSVSLFSKENELKLYVQSIEKTKNLLQEEQRKLDCFHNEVWQKRDRLCKSIFNFTERYRPYKIKKMLQYQDLVEKNEENILDEAIDKLLQKSIQN